MRADAPTLDRIMSDDFYFTYPLEGDDKASVISDVTSGELKIEHFARDHVSVRIFGSTAVLTARDAATWMYHGRELAGTVQSHRSFLPNAKAGGKCAPFRLARCSNTKTNLLKLLPGVPAVNFWLTSRLSCHENASQHEFSSILSPRISPAQ